MNLLPSKVLQFEESLDTAFDSLPCWTFDGAATLYLIGNLIEECHAQRQVDVSRHFDRGLSILAPRLILQSRGAKPTIKQVVEALDFAGHYYALRDYLFYTYNAPGSCSWSFEGSRVSATFVDRTIPRQYWLQFLNFVVTSSGVYSRSSRADRIVEKLNGAPEFESSEGVSRAMKWIGDEADEKLAHYFSLLPPESTIRFGSYRYCDFYSVARSLLIKALYHRYQAKANGHVGSVHIGKDELCGAMCLDHNLTPNEAREILRDLTYGETARREGIEPMYYGLFDLQARDQVLMVPHRFSTQDYLVNFLRIAAKRDPSSFQANVAPGLDAGFHRVVRSIFESRGFQCFERLSLKRFGHELPDVDLLVISEERTLGYFAYACELKGILPPQWSKDHLRVLRPDALPKAFRQLGQVVEFLMSKDGGEFIRALIPEEGLPHFGEEFLVAAQPLVITTNNAGMFLADRPCTVIDYRTLQRIVDRSDGDIVYINHFLAELDNLLDETIESEMIACRIEGLTVDYEGVIGQGRFFDFPEHNYRSVGADKEIAEGFIEEGGHPYDVLSRLAEFKSRHDD